MNPIFSAGFLLSGEIFIQSDFSIVFNSDDFNVFFPLDKSDLSIVFTSNVFNVFFHSTGLARSLPLLLLGKVLLGFAAGAQVGFFHFVTSSSHFQKV